MQKFKLLTIILWIWQGIIWIPRFGIAMNFYTNFTYKSKAIQVVLFEEGGGRASFSQKSITSRHLTPRPSIFQGRLLTPARAMDRNNFRPCFFCRHTFFNFSDCSCFGWFPVHATVTVIQQNFSFNNLGHITMARSSGWGKQFDRIVNPQPEVRTLQAFPHGGICGIRSHYPHRSEGNGSQDNTFNRWTTASHLCHFVTLSKNATGVVWYGVVVTHLSIREL